MMPPRARQEGFAFLRRTAPRGRVMARRRGLVRCVGLALAVELLPRRSGCRQDGEHVGHADGVRRLGGNEAEELPPIARVTKEIRDMRRPRSQALVVELNRAGVLVLERRCCDGGERGRQTMKRSCPARKGRCQDSSENEQGWAKGGFSVGPIWQLVRKPRQAVQWQRRRCDCAGSWKSGAPQQGSRDNTAGPCNSDQVPNSIPGTCFCSEPCNAKT